MFEIYGKNIRNMCNTIHVPTPPRGNTGHAKHPNTQTPAAIKSRGGGLRPPPKGGGGPLSLIAGRCLGVQVFCVTCVAARLCWNMYCTAWLGLAWLDLEWLGLPAISKLPSKAP